MSMPWDVNIYYHPDAHGLTVVGEVEAAGAYEFDKFVVWADERGRLYWGTDSGCSCPTPFEDILSPSYLSSGSKTELSAALTRWFEGDGDDYRRKRRASSRQDGQRLLTNAKKIRRAR